MTTTNPIAHLRALLDAAKLELVHLNATLGTPTVMTPMFIGSGRFVQANDAWLAALANSGDALLAVAHAAAAYVNLSSEHAQERGGVFRDLCNKLDALTASVKP